MFQHLRSACSEHLIKKYRMRSTKTALVNEQNPINSERVRMSLRRSEEDGKNNHSPFPYFFEVRNRMYYVYMHAGILKNINKSWHGVPIMTPLPKRDLRILHVASVTSEQSGVNDRCAGWGVWRLSGILRRIPAWSRGKLRVLQVGFPLGDPPARGIPTKSYPRA
jgi:hypothetical protein